MRVRRQGVGFTITLSLLSLSLHVQVDFFPFLDGALVFLAPFRHIWPFHLRIRRHHRCVSNRAIPSIVRFIPRIVQCALNSRWFSLILYHFP